LKILLLNQCFYPDVVSTAQHLSDLAVELANSGHEVTVLAANRGYDDAFRRFPKQESWQGIRIIRIASLSLGKQSKWRRALNFASFLGLCALRLLFLPRFDVVVALTSPPLISVLAALFVRLKGGAFYFWVMDLNPDEALAANWLKENSPAARLLSSLLRYSLRQAVRVIVLDRFMLRRVIEKGTPREKVTVIPPWSHTDAVAFDAPGRLAFRATHQLTEKYVVMYSGNHSPCHSLDTLLAAARNLADYPGIAFCFVGGGSEFEKVKMYAEEHRLRNIKCLPYQPLDGLSASLSAADLQVVVMGAPFVGIVHPCKIYNILEIGSSVLYIGPPQSHVVDVLARVDDQSLVCSVRHGDVEAVTRYIVSEAERLQGRRQTGTVKDSFSRGTLVPQMIAVLESVPAGKFRSNPMVSKSEGRSPSA
jgi:colanic acid biosynthesis glycosyl transferase WcaI